MPTAFTDAELAHLYDRYAGVLHHRCQRILGDPDLARDAVHDTFAKVITQSDQFRAQSSPLTWMYRIATNHCLNQIRNRKSRQAKLDQRHDEFVAQAVTEPDVTSLERQRLMELIESTDEQTRKVVVHTWFDNCSKAETARLVGISVPTVRKRLNTFIAHARTLLTLALLSLWNLP